LASFLSFKNIYHRYISKVGAFFRKSRKAKAIFFLVPTIILAILSVGITAYFDLPPGAQVARYFNLSAENKTDLLDVVAIADFSGPTRMIGQDLAQGFKDAASAGKISNDVRLIIRDDRGNADAVAALADSAAAGFGTLAVIGPTQAMGYQDMISSLEEGMVPGLVPISPPSMHQKEKWIFALQPSQERQGEFVSNLLLKAQKTNSTAFVVFESDKKNGYAAGFQKVFSKFGKNNFALKIWPKTNDKDAIAQLVQSLSGFDYVAFSLPADDAVQLVRALKDANYTGQLIGFGGASLPNFPERFSQFPKEQLAPGFYTNGLMSVTPFIPSMANERAREFINDYQRRYQANPSWAYAYGYDAGYLLSTFIEKLKQETPEWKKLPPDEVRKNFQGYLASLNKGQGNDGAFTGQMRLDQNQERDIPPTLVSFQSGKQLPYLLQYGTDAARFNFSEKISENKIQVDDRVYDLVPLIFTGLIPREISFINLEKRTFTGEVDIWFRGSFAIDAEDIVFPSLFTDNPSFSVLESSDGKNEKYRLFRFRGVFKFDALAKDLALGQLPLSISFRHKYLDSSQLRFVIDETNNGSSASIIKGMEKSEVLAPEMDYRPETTSLAIDTTTVSSLGNPASLTGERNFSEFRASYGLRNKHAMFGSYIGSKLDWKISCSIALLFAIIALLPWLIKKRFSAQRKLSRLITIEFSLLTVFFCEVGLFFSPALDKVNTLLLVAIQNSFTAFYYFAFAATLNLCVDWFIQKQESKKTALQGSLRVLLSIIIYSTSFGFYYTDVLRRDILPVLAASSVILTVVGLALRELILDALGGITIGLEGAIKPGDWISINAKDHEIDGRVEELGWRNVRIHSRDGLVHFIPNSVLIQQTVSNASSDGGFSRVEIPFEVSPSANLEQLIESIRLAVIDLLKDNEFVDHAKAIRIICEEIESDGVQLEAHIFYRADQSRDQLSTAILELVNRILREQNALPFMSIALKDR